MSKDYYSILWIEKNASQDEIKKAYRKMAMQYHPDRNSGSKEAESKFKDVNEAYGVLGDESKRKQYDTFWSTGWNPFGWAGWGFQADFDISDIFESMFGGNAWGSRWWARKRKTEFKWEDIETSIHLDLKTSVFWGKEEIAYSKLETCGSCKWEGWEGKKTCEKCKWHGQVTYRQQSMFWTIQHTATCDACAWSWETIDKVCMTCSGQKRVRVTKKIPVDIPAWIDDWMIIKIEGEWNDGVWTKAKWDLFIRFRVSLEEKGLNRKWTDLFYDLEIDIIEAILGTDKEINIPVIWKRTIKIDQWTQFWTVIKLSGDWVKFIDRDAKWDLYINISIKVPKKLSSVERASYETIAREKKIKTHNKKWILHSLFD